jgi:hypothetical protein
MVLHYVEPWLSKSDIEAGERWATEVARELEATKFGIICMTRENAVSPWILFEAGALAKSIQDGRVVPLLLDIEFKDITGPLAQFQAKKADKSRFSDIVESINRYSDIKLPDGRLYHLFEALWSSLKEKVESIESRARPAKHNRSQSEILEELVTSIRGVDAFVRSSAVSVSANH